jgi:dolichol-phosphate mannosyltransferase
MNEVFTAVQTTAAATRRQAVELSVIVPTFKERGNVPLLIERLDAALAGIGWEVIFVDDDSPDGTATVVKQIATSDPRVRCLRRVSRRGLAGACIEGMLMSAAPYVAVMDADLQHDETRLPRMLEILQSGEKDLVVGSRYMPGGDAAAFSRTRGSLSRIATGMAKRLTGVTLNDPMSGFFMMRRDCFDAIAGRLTPYGFKILLDIVITAKALRVAEEPFTFAARQHGESKLDSQVALDFLGLLLGKLTGGAVTTRFLSFALVGGFGVLVHMAVLYACLYVLNTSFPVAQAAATFVAMTNNFLLNNRLTYRDARLTGPAMLRGLLGFYLVSAIGALANVGIASWLYAGQAEWWIAGIAGAAMGVVWNYAMSTVFVWRVK